MNEWLKKLLEKIKTVWGKITVVQKVILGLIVVGVIAGIIALFTVSSSPTMVPILNTSINDENLRDRILVRLDEENVRATVSANNVIMVQDESTARRMRSILIREDLIPQDTSPWDIFNRDSWTQSDFQNDVNLQQAITTMVTRHIEALDDVDDATVIITFPKDVLFASEREPVKASVLISARPGSDITTNRKKIEGIQKLVIYAVDGLTAENIVISDSLTGKILNDFEGMADFDELTLTEKQQKLISAKEAEYKAKVLTALQRTYGEDRVRDLNVNIYMDMSKEEITATEFYPITVKEDDPTTPYDDSEFAMSVTRSSQTATTRWQGTGYNPEGPSGMEGQTAPVYKDSSNLYGMTEQSIVTKNEEINSRNISTKRSPKVNKVTVSVNIDGTWKIKTDENGRPIVNPDGSREREYTPLTTQEIQDTEKLIQDAIGYDVKRGDSVTVTNIKFYRDPEFAEADAAFLKEQQTEKIILYVMIGFTIILVIFVVSRLIMREIERRRRLKEEERQRLQQAERERRLWEAEQAGMEVSMSVEERKRLELQENAINMAKEHPEDVALLIRTWLMEE